ncbi:MAG: LPS export ABC transporter periplasmic protein LptC [Azoarcus sp.]|jgi:lipopolysaccharide export system protein LptC|nr:LPS export ABC transporter periplasmic protein LptC [Azoarcus sp.]
MHTAHFVYRLYPLVIAALLAAGSIWLEHLTRPPGDAALAKNSSAPDFTSDVVRVTGFSKDGSLRYTLDSPHITHLPQTNTTGVNKPRLQLFSRGQRMWINSEYGEVAPKGERVDFTGNVEAERDSGPAEPPLHFSSAKLTVWPEEQRAESDVPVRIIKGETRANANRFAADNVFGVMKLSDKVRMSLPRNRRNS